MPRIALAAAFLALALPSFAVADPPIVDRYPSSEEFVWDACGFPVRIQIDGIATDHLFLDDAGALERLIGTGRFQAVLTNLASGESLTLNIPGPLFSELHADGGRTVTIRGPWLLLYRPESLETLPLVPWLFLFEGQRVLTVEADGTRTVTWRGRFVDLCAELAS